MTLNGPEGRDGGGGGRRGWRESEATPPERGAALRPEESPEFSPSPQLRKGRRTRQEEHEREEEGDASVDSVDSVEAKFQQIDGWKGVDGQEPCGRGRLVGSRLRAIDRSHRAGPDRQKSGMRPFSALVLFFDRQPAGRERSGRGSGVSPHQVPRRFRTGRRARVSRPPSPGFRRR
jgi:hypothetical protein